MKTGAKKILALMLALSLVLAFAACDNGENVTDESTTTAAGETVNSDIGENETSVDGQTTPSTDSSEPESNQDVTEKDSNNPQTPSNNKKPVQTKGLNSTDIKTVLEFYKTAAKKTGTIDAEQTMTLAQLNYTPRNNVEKTFLNAFEGIAKAALKANSVERTDIPGNEQALQTSDINSANAVVSGNYTIVTLNVKSQEDNQDTKDAGQGPVGHAVGTLGDVTLALNEIPAVKVDYSKGSITLRYDSCKVVVKIDNNTGKIVSGTWSYTVNAWLVDLNVTFLSASFKVTNMGGAVNFVVKTKD